MQTNELNPFNYFKPPIRKITPDSTINIRDVHKEITTSGELKDLTLQLRKLTREEQIRKFKINKLPSITPSGIFHERKDDSLIQHSGLIALDFDDIEPEEIPHIKERLLSDKNIPTTLLFTSPSGHGLKWIAPISPAKDRHKLIFSSISNYLKNQYNLIPDANCANISRACFLGYDSEAYLDLNGGMVDYSFVEEWKPKDYIQNSSKTLSENNIQKLITEIKLRSIDITKDYKDWVKIGWGLCELDESGRQYFHEISQFYPKYDWDEANNKYSKLLEDYDGRVKIASVFEIAKKHGVHFKDSQIEPERLNIATPRTASQRMQDAKTQAPVQSLVGSLWYSGELHILFADTGQGKSVWAVQIADALSKGENPLELLHNEFKPQKVLYYDFEMSDKQFEKRYTNEDGHGFTFSENFLIDNINIGNLVLNNPQIESTTLIIQKIESDIIERSPNVLIIDNISSLTSEATQDVNVAQELMRKLNEWKRKYNLSICVIAHTPKIEEGKNITINNLAGSKQLSNLADSISAIGRSNRGKDIKYIKSLKCRGGEMVHDRENVISVRLEKTDSFLGFTFIECGNENSHFKTEREIEHEREKKELLDRAWLMNQNGISLRDIEKDTGISKSVLQRNFRNR